MAVGNKLGIPARVLGFDIQTRRGVNRAFLINGKTLHRVDLVAGFVTSGRPVSGLHAPVRDLAVLLP